jgi:hypothetical protein
VQPHVEISKENMVKLRQVLKTPDPTLFLRQLCLNPLTTPYFVRVMCLQCNLNSGA